MLIVYLDDDVENLRDVAREIRSLGNEVETFAGFSEFQAAWTDRGDDLVALIDHDLGIDGTTGRSVSGYDAVAWLRSTHPNGLLLPIVYLTGRETIDGFVAHQASEPYAHPTLYLSKGEAAMPTFDWSRLLDDLSNKYREAQSVDEEQRVERGLALLRSLDEGREA